MVFGFQFREARNKINYGDMTGSEYLLLALGLEPLHPFVSNREASMIDKREYTS